MRMTDDPHAASRALVTAESSALEAPSERPPALPESWRSTASALWWKRPIDLAIGLPLLLACLPLIGLLALIVRLDSPGPAFFRQERVGLHGKRFRMWKLRTMFTGSADARHRQAAVDRRRFSSKRRAQSRADPTTAHPAFRSGW